MAGHPHCCPRSWHTTLTEGSLSPDSGRVGSTSELTPKHSPAGPKLLCQAEPSPPAAATHPLHFLHLHSGLQQTASEMIDFCLQTQPQGWKLTSPVSRCILGIRCHFAHDSSSSVAQSALQPIGAFTENLLWARAMVICPLTLSKSGTSTMGRGSWDLALISWCPQSPAQSPGRLQALHWRWVKNTVPRMGPSGRAFFVCRMGW